MSSDFQGAVPPVGGVSADADSPSPLPVLVSTSTDGKGKNTVRMDLIPVACWKINDVRFAFGSSFVLPASRAEFQTLFHLREEHPNSPMSIFGHADPVGDDAFNKRLSGHRAESVYAVLTRDAARWEKLYAAARPGEGWGTACIQEMLAALGYNPGPVSGTLNEATKASIRKFQENNDLSPDSQAGPLTRKKLFTKYMEFLYPEALPKQAFLGRGLDAGGKADYQGCGEFNPVMLFSQQEEQAFSRSQSKEDRNRENGVNRRVMVLLFRKDSFVAANKWPCPRADEGVAGCRRRFWSDGEKRRTTQLPDQRRRFEQTHDTLACRFYQRLTDSSPCEQPSPLVRIKLRLLDVYHAPRQNAHYVLQVGELRFEGHTNSDGVLTHMVPASATEGTLQLKNWQAQLDLVAVQDLEDEPGRFSRLSNLGYHPAGPEEECKLALMRFQSANDEEANGELTEATRSKLRRAYGC
jgi:hypothetical protein